MTCKKKDNSGKDHRASDLHQPQRVTGWSHRIFFDQWILGNLG